MQFVAFCQDLCLCCCHGPAPRFKMLTFILTLTISHFTITQLFAAYIFVNWSLVTPERPLSSAWEYSNSPRIKNLWQPNSNVRFLRPQGSRGQTMQSNKSDKQLLPSEAHLRFLVIDLKKGFKILGFCHYHRSDMQNFKYKLYTLDLGPSHSQCKDKVQSH